MTGRDQRHLSIIIHTVRSALLLVVSATSPGEAALRRRANSVPFVSKAAHIKEDVYNLLENSKAWAVDDDVIVQST
jgi:hypothetical protein